MITNKDIRVENGSLILNGDPYPLDGQSPEAIMQIVEDNSDTTPTENSDAPITSGGVFTANKTISDIIGDITQTGITGASVAAQLTQLGLNITPQTSGEWKWIELPGNLVLMWCNHIFGEIGDLVQEGPFYKANLTRLTYPITFAAAPGVWVQKIGNGQGLIIGTGDGGTTTQTPDFTIGRYTSSSLIYGCTLSFFVVGIKSTT